MKDNEAQFGQFRRGRKGGGDAPSSGGADFIDLARLRVSHDFSSAVGVKKVLRTVPVRKPAKHDCVRVRDGDEWYLETAVLTLDDGIDRDTYLVDPDVLPDFPGEVAPTALFLTINRQGVLTLWPVRLPGEAGRQTEWIRSALEAASYAKRGWIRSVARMSLGAYEIYAASAELSEPDWPTESFEEIVTLAFRERYIRTPDHPVVRRLRGGV